MVAEDRRWEANIRAARERLDRAQARLEARKNDEVLRGQHARERARLARIRLRTQASSSIACARCRATPLDCSRCAFNSSNDEEG